VDVIPEVLAALARFSPRDSISKGETVGQ